MNSESPDNATRKFRKELNSGAVSLVLLALLGDSRKAMYGYEIARRLEAIADGELPMNQGALYPVLRSLEKQQMLSSEVEPSTSGPPRRYYRITKLGRQALKKWTAAWRDTTNFVNLILGENNADKSEGSHSKVSGKS